MYAYMYMFIYSHNSYIESAPSTERVLHTMTYIHIYMHIRVYTHTSDSYGGSALPSDYAQEIAAHQYAYMYM